MLLVLQNKFLKLLSIVLGANDIDRCPKNYFINMVLA